MVAIAQTFNLDIDVNNMLHLRGPGGRGRKGGRRGSNDGQQTGNMLSPIENRQIQRAVKALINDLRSIKNGLRSHAENGGNYANQCNGSDSTSGGDTSQELGTVSRSGQDSFNVCGNEVTLATMIAMLMQERVENIEDGIADYGQEVKNRNLEVQYNNETIAHVRANEDSGSLTDEQIAYYEDKGYDLPYTSWSGEDGDEKAAAVIDTLKEKNNSLNSENQMDMIYLQQNMTARSQAFDLMTNILSKVAKGADSILGNMR